MTKSVVSKKEERAFSSKRTFKLDEKKESVFSKKAFLKYGVFFLCMVLASLARIEGSIQPFGWAVYGALLLCGQSILLLAPLYAASAIIQDPTVYGIIAAVLAAALPAVAVAIHRRTKTRIPLLCMLAYSVAGQGIAVWFDMAAGENLLKILLSIGIGALFLCVVVQVAKAVVLNKLKYKLSRVELLAMFLCVIVAAAGIHSIKLFGVSLLPFAAALAILVSVRSLGAGYAFALGAACGLGAAFDTLGVEYVGAFVLMALAAAIFSPNKFLAAAAVVLVDIITGYYFFAYGAYEIWQLIPLAAGAAVSLLIPKKELDRFGDSILGTHDKNALRYLINRDREELSEKLHEISGVFLQMQGVYNSLVQDKPVLEGQTTEYLCGKLCQRLCGDCPKNGDCLGEKRTTTAKSFLELMEAAMVRGKASLLDITPDLAAQCNRLNSLVSISSQLAAEYHGTREVLDSDDRCKLTVADQMGGVSRILSGLAESAASGVAFDIERERRIIEELTYVGIVCSEALVYEDGGKLTLGGAITGGNGQISGVTAVVKSETFDRDLFKKAVCKICRATLEITEVEAAARAGWSVVSMAQETKLDVVFGCASVGKGNATESGDTHSFLRLAGTKFMIALSDGMGSGKTANRLSTTAVSLVENFYRAGFDSELVVSSVNRFLATSSEETFSAVDLCVIDLVTGQTDIIKIGAPFGFIKHKDDVEIVDTSALPLGVLEEIRPSVSRRILHHGDMAVFCTDGITDLLSRTELANIINNTRTSNPQKLAETVLARAYALDKSLPHDDMTVVVARLYDK